MLALKVIIASIQIFKYERVFDTPKLKDED